MRFSDDGEPQGTAGTPILDATEKQKFGLEKDPESMSEKELKQLIAKLDKEMKHAALELQFERAAELRDKILEIKKLL